MRLVDVRIGKHYAVQVPGLASPRQAVVAAISPFGVWVRVVRYRNEELMHVRTKAVIACWESYTALLADRRADRLARREARAISA